MHAPVGYLDMNTDAKITITRHRGFVDRLRAYQVRVDGAVVGSVKAGESASFSVPDGRHSLIMRIDWCGSAQLGFEATAGEHLTFECGSSLAGWRLLLAPLYVTIRTDQYLWLRRTA